MKLLLRMEHTPSSHQRTVSLRGPRRIRVRRQPHICNATILTVAVTDDCGKMRQSEARRGRVRQKETGEVVAAL